MLIPRKKDQVSALLLIAIGAAAVMHARSYDLGTLVRMGPGFMPMAFGIVLCALGVAIGVSSREVSTASRGSDWRGWLCIVGGVLWFVLLGRFSGLIPAAFGSVFIAAMGDRRNKVRDAAALAAVLTVAGVLVFSFGLHLPLPLI